MKEQIEKLIEIFSDEEFRLEYNENFNVLNYYLLKNKIKIINLDLVSIEDVSLILGNTKLQYK